VIPSVVNGNIWPWIATALLTAAGFLAGDKIGSTAANDDMALHKESPGHPVVMERVENMRYQLDRIEAKIDDLLGQQ